jgi:molybdenum cofactor cytidylyltransferase
MQNIAAILLAAGESSRMGQPKALLDWEGVTLIRHQVDSLLHAGASPVIVVLGHKPKSISPEIPSQAIIVVNKNYKNGRSSSVKKGLKALEKNSLDIAILGVDQPRSPSLLTTLFVEHRKAKALISRPTYEGKHGHPIIFNTRLLAELLDIDDESQGLRDVVHRHEEVIHDVQVSTTEVLLDLNSPEEYQAAVKSQARN